MQSTNILLRSLICLALTVVGQLFASLSYATPITQPPDLSPGDKYRLVFITSNRRDATSTDISDYNTFVTNTANTIPALVALDTTWTAIGSTPTVNARDNTATSPLIATGLPIYTLAGLLVAADNADLWDGSINVPIGVQEDGFRTFRNFAFTGTRPDGLRSESGNLGTPFRDVLGGLPIRIDDRWIEVSIRDKSVRSSFYAISGELTVVPEPSAIFLLCLGAAGLIGFARRRRKRPAKL